MDRFKAEIEIIGINPFVSVPDKILDNIFEQTGTNKGRIPIRGLINDKPYRQTLVKYLGSWRLYINTTMLKNSPKRVGETVEVSVLFDEEDRTIQPHPMLLKALNGTPKAKEVFENLTPSRQKEIVRYISQLKTEKSIEKNIQKAIDFLLGKCRFVGRSHP